MGPQENAYNYDKGVLADILEPIMGKGLIPADLETWKPRRKAVVPAFHKAYLQAMCSMFIRCSHVSGKGGRACARKSYCIKPVLKYTTHLFAKEWWCVRGAAPYADV